ncbi:antitoxin [Nocardioides sp. Y6]|uniref:Antitoxin n=1 Tax=Nocardioides malaquae TaxID=2773426 RepID=A0ABR9RWD6_9ACTN|nr:antitoxin [Nocardioides malaquae]MBE7325900.1 antitoxin [Nocardioides malaquae]
MRTTVTLDPDTEQVIRERMATKGVSFKVALNDAIRDGARGRVDHVFTTETFDLGVPTVDLTKSNVLAADLEDAELVARLGFGPQR